MICQLVPFSTIFSDL